MTDIAGTMAAVAAAKARAMGHTEKQIYLRSRGWRPERASRWIAPNGLVASLANAVRLQALADAEKDVGGA